MTSDGAELTIRERIVLGALCRRCGAGRGYPCQTKSGKLTTSVHEQRRTDYHVRWGSWRHAGALTFTEWTPPEGDMHGPEPVCLTGGPATHPWQLSIESGQPTLTTDCLACTRQFDWIDWHDDLEMEAIPVTLESHVETYGWETPEYDHWWIVTPLRQVTP